MSGYLTEQIGKSRQFESLFEELLEGVYDLVEGKLFPHLIRADTMLKTLQDIKSILDKKFPGFHLVYRNDFRQETLVFIRICQVSDFTFPTTNGSFLKLNIFLYHLTTAQIMRLNY